MYWESDCFSNYLFFQILHGRFVKYFFKLVGVIEERSLKEISNKFLKKLSGKVSFGVFQALLKWSPGLL